MCGCDGFLEELGGAWLLEIEEHGGRGDIQMSQRMTKVEDTTCFLGGLQEEAVEFPARDGEVTVGAIGAVGLVDDF